MSDLFSMVNPTPGVSMNSFIRRGIQKIILVTGLCFFFGEGSSQELYPVSLSDQRWHHQEHELRYRPEGRDFVITNGTRLFTRALYGTHTAFRIEAGDRPEFALYMPGMGGNLKLGLGTAQQSKWLTQADRITARYRPGAMLYTIEDALLGTGKLQVEILAMSDAEGFLIKTRMESVPQTVTLYWAFGGASGKKFSRNGDMGPDPESNFYLKPENCVDNRFDVSSPGTFQLEYGTGIAVGIDGNYVSGLPSTKPAQHLVGTCSPETRLIRADATHLSSPIELYGSTAHTAPVVAGAVSILSDTAYYLAIHNPATHQGLSYGELPAAFERAEIARQQLANRIVVTTPDPYLNTIGGAVSVASDAIWESPSYLHGAIGWRMRLNGWRGAYTADVLGWHDRARTHLLAYAESQLTTPARGPVVADTSMHLARSAEQLGTGMFTSGYISRDPNGRNLRPHHYDMNLVYIDQLLRHINWTGDTSFMRQIWPVLKRHLEWEVRNFDPDGNGLFDAYAAIWASDALQYSGGDVTHTTAYNYLAFRKAAQIASILGENPEPYQTKAHQILKALQQHVWMPSLGTFAEFRDGRGHRLLHPAAALWTIYHSIDSEVPDPFQSYQMLRYVDTDIPHIPIHTQSPDTKGSYTLSTTNWMPYVWSLNNVALAESMHTALANWQAGRTEEAFRLFKSEVLQSMYLGGSPGNIVQISYFDAARGEAYRDFADPVGMFSRALVEGLFGIVPDALTRTLLIRPGLPQAWNEASFSSPDVAFDFKRSGKNDTYTVRSSLGFSLKWQIIAQGQVHRITVNDQPVSWKNVAQTVGKPVIEFTAPVAREHVIRITWKGPAPVLPRIQTQYVTGSTFEARFPEARIVKVYDPQRVFTRIRPAGSVLRATIQAATGPVTAFVQLRQGLFVWWMPLCFQVTNAFDVLPSSDSQHFRIQNHTEREEDVLIRVNESEKSVRIPAGKASEEIAIPEPDLRPGTNPVRLTTSTGKTISTHLINWNGRKTGPLEMIDLEPVFNDQVTQIFRNTYLSPRPQTTTLQLPWQGIGDWPHPHETFEVDDSGLRNAAGPQQTIQLSQGLWFRTPSQAGAKNILFTSQWDNYPNETTIPLSGNASHAYFLMAGSTNPMQSQFTNGEIIVHYTDASADTLTLRNPETWWPIDQDYYTDHFAFSLKQPRPIRVHLQSGTVVSGEESERLYNGKKIPGGAATVLDLPLDPTKTLKSLTLRTIANDVVIGLMSVTLVRIK